MIILGAGAGGLCMAMRLRRAGHDDFFLHERADGIGGTWRDNTWSRKFPRIPRSPRT